MTDTFTKLASSIITSSIWSEDDKTRIVWITMLAMCDRDGFVETSIPGLSAVARVSLQDTVNAIKKLSSPDEFSRGSDYEGRRIQQVEGGFVILNHGKYRDKLRGETRREYLRNYMRDYMQSVRQEKSNNGLTDVKPSVSVSVSASESSQEGIQGEKSLVTDFDKFWTVYPKKKAKADAQKAWKQTAKTRPSVEIVVAKIKELSMTEDWKKSGGQFIPYPASWLRAGCWDDVIEGSTRTPAKPANLTQEEFANLNLWREVLPKMSAKAKTAEEIENVSKIKVRLQELEAKAAQ